jgi:hypothetical protein
MVRKRKEDLEMLNEKEEQLKILASAHTWGLKESI